MRHGFELSVPSSLSALRGFDPDTLPLSGDLGHFWCLNSILKPSVPCVAFEETNSVRRVGNLNNDYIIVMNQRDKLTLRDK